MHHAPKLLLFLGCLAAAAALAAEPPYEGAYDVSGKIWATAGSNTYCILQPGFQLVLQNDHERATITVLDETRTVMGIETRVVEERTEIDGALKEVSKNYYALCRGTRDVVYFGEDVDYYEDGKLVHHAGSWLAGEGDAQPGLLMPGTPEPGMKYYQEYAPGRAMDRAKVRSVTLAWTTPAGTFSNCLGTVDGSALNPDEVEIKVYAPGIGQIVDEDLKLVRYGFVESKP